MGDEPKRIQTGDRLSWPGMLEDACHMALNGRIVMQREGCQHGTLGGQEALLEPQGSSVVTEIDHENKTITFDS